MRGARVLWCPGNANINGSQTYLNAFVVCMCCCLIFGVHSFLFYERL
jgi:hypothetical protein